MRAYPFPPFSQAILPWLVAGVLAGATFLLLVTILPGVQTMEVDLELDHVDRLRVYYAHRGVFSETRASAGVVAGTERNRYTLFPKAGSFNRVRLDPGERGGTVRLYGIRVHSYFAPDLVLGPQEIAERFAPGTPEVQLRRVGDHLEITSAADDPYLQSRGRLYPRMPLAALAMGLTSGVMAGLVTRAWLTSRTAAARKPVPAPHRHLPALDGLRGYAALLVIADHTMGWFSGVGTSGVYIFFTLSGFLLARPFIREPERAWSLASLCNYLLRRFTRILPMYWTYLFVVFALTRRFDEALLHTLFVAGIGHLWAIPQEILFYLLLPLLMLPLAASNRAGRWWMPLALCVLMLLWNRLGTTKVVWLLGMDFARMKFFLGVFLAGVLAAFVHEYLEATPLHREPGRILHQLWSPLGFILLVFFVLFSTGRIYGDAIVLSQRYFGIYGLLAALLVLCTARTAGGLLPRLLAWPPLRGLGIISLSLYLLHPLVKTLVDTFLFHYTGRHLQGFPLFLATVAGSTLLAAWTYTRIERQRSVVAVSERN